MPPGCNGMLVAPVVLGEVITGAGRVALVVAWVVLVVELVAPVVMVVSEDCPRQPLNIAMIRITVRVKIPAFFIEFPPVLLEFDAIISENDVITLLIFAVRVVSKG